MCGIVGSFNISSQGDLKIREASQAIKHRGPDGFGYWEEGNINLGHRRLSIIDLSNAAGQPMTSFNKDVVLVFNGEIYNYLDLKIELKNKAKFLKKSISNQNVINKLLPKYNIDDFENFKKFLKKLKKLEKLPKIVFRPHPAENLSEWEKIK